jgi:DNA replication protein DnaC
MNPHAIKQACHQLRLSGLYQSLEQRLSEARHHQLPHGEFLELVLQDELSVRAQRQLERRKQRARFAEERTLESFDWDFNPSIQRSAIYQLASCQFVREKRDALFLGPPGVGKSHLMQAIGYAAVKAGFEVLYCSVFDLVRELQADQTPAEAQKSLHRYLKPDLVCVDDFGMKHFPPKSAESLLELVVRRHRNRSTMMTSNRPIEEWGQLLGDVPSATAILDRFLQQAEVIQMKGRSHRMRGKAVEKASGEGIQKPKDSPETPSEAKGKK